MHSATTPVDRTAALIEPRAGAGAVENASSVSDERALVLRVKNLDEGAWEELFHAYYERLCTYLRYQVGNASAAEDLASQAFAEAVAGIKRFEYRGVSIGAWLFRIARNLSNDHLRKERARPAVAMVPPEAPHPLRLLERDLEAQQVMAALDHVTEEQRQVLVLRFVSELSTADTAKAMQKSEGATKALQHRALAAARRALLAMDPAWEDRNAKTNR